MATARSVNTYSIGFLNKDDEAAALPDNWTPHDIEYEGLPLVNFLRDESLEILKQKKISSRFTITYFFVAPICVEVKGHAVEIKAFRLIMECSEKYVSQIVEENVTLGHYDFLNDTVSIPDKEALTVGHFDNFKWTEVDTTKFKVEARELQPNSVQFGLTLFKPIKGVDRFGTPPFLRLIKERLIDARENSRLKVAAGDVAKRKR